MSAASRVDPIATRRDIRMVTSLVYQLPPAPPPPKPPPPNPPKPPPGPPNPPPPKPPPHIGPGPQYTRRPRPPLNPDIRAGRTKNSTSRITSSASGLRS